MKLILKLNEKKASGYDSISNKVLKNRKRVIAPYIVNLFNTCMHEGVFPECFKKAQVVPLFKGGVKQPKLPSSNFVTTSNRKTFRKVVSTRMTEFLIEHKVLSNQQFGFRKDFSTELAILDIYEKLLSNLDKGLNSCAIFLILLRHSTQSIMKFYYKNCLNMESGIVCLTFLGLI